MSCFKLVQCETHYFDLANKYTPTNKLNKKVFRGIKSEVGNSFNAS